MEAAITIKRTPELIATEINSIKSQTRMMMLCSSIEIGRRLVEAKSMIPHGEWGKWLGNSVDYSQSTANNLMRIFEEYGADQLSLFGSEAKSQALGNLLYTQAVALLKLPSDKREQFIEEHDIENMSTRELQQAIKERDQALKQNQELEDKLKATEKELQDANNSYETVNSSYEKLSELNHEHFLKAESLRKEVEGLKQQLTEAQISGDSNEVERLKADLQEADGLLIAANQEIEELNKQLQAKPIDVPAAQIIEKIPEEVEQELTALRKQKKSAAILKYSMHFNSLVKGFQDLLGSLVVIEQEDPQEGERYKHATLELISKMSARL